MRLAILLLPDNSDTALDQLIADCAVLVLKDLGKDKYKRWRVEKDRFGGATGHDISTNLVPAMVLDCSNHIDQTGRERTGGELTIGMKVKNSPVGSGTITDFNDRNYPRVNGVAVTWLELEDGSTYGDVKKR